MSNGINQVTLFGNLGATPELRFTSLGTPILKMRIATNDAYYDKDKKLVERVDWHDVAMFGARAEPLSRLLNKGDSVVIAGSLRYSSYEKEGVTRYRTEIVARDLCLATRRRSVINPDFVNALPEDPYPAEAAQPLEQVIEATPIEAAPPSAPAPSLLTVNEGSRRRRGRSDSNGATAQTEEVSV
jgi:single-strand DNA-binding protein